MWCLEGKLAISPVEDRIVNKLSTNREAEDRMDKINQEEFFQRSKSNSKIKRDDRCSCIVGNILLLHLDFGQDSAEVIYQK